jgi:formylglycine-generating enzyme required for sulfatase activity
MNTIPAGTFQMGDMNTNLLIQGSGSSPLHSVTLGAFTISQTLITQEQYQAVMDTNPSYFKSVKTLPVESVTWYDAVLYCNALSKMEGKDTVYTFSSIIGKPGAGCSGLGNLNIDYTKNGYRLPTEAEYEYACRAGNDTNDYYWGRNYPPITAADTLAIDNNAVWYLNSPNCTQPVATKKPNSWGLYDMSGNVWEWCNDWYGSYSDSSQTNPTGATSGSYRVLRGGTWNDGNIYSYGDDALCAAYRLYFSPENSGFSSGFRVVCGAR